MKNSIEVKVSSQILTVDSLTITGLINCTEMLFSVMDKEDLRFGSVLTVLDNVYPKNDLFWSGIREKKMSGTTKSSLEAIREENQIATELNEMIFQAVFSHKYLKDSLSVIFPDDSMFWIYYYEWELIELANTSKE